MYNNLGISLDIYLKARKILSDCFTVIFNDWFILTVTGENIKRAINNKWTWLEVYFIVTRPALRRNEWMNTADEDFKKKGCYVWYSYIVVYVWCG